MVPPEPVVCDKGLSITLWHVVLFPPKAKMPLVLVVVGLFGWELKGWPTRLAAELTDFSLSVDGENVESNGFGDVSLFSAYSTSDSEDVATTARVVSIGVSSGL